MTYNPSIKPPMRNVTPPTQTPQTPNAYCPSVPISVYRELAAELQAAQAMLDSLNAQNQQLTKQNQHLRQEFDRVIQSAMQAQQVVASWQPVGRSEAPPVVPEFRPEPTPSANVRRTPPPPLPSPAAEVLPPPVPAYPVEPEKGTPVVEKLFTEQEQGRYRRPTPPERAGDISGLWLVAAIFLIVATAFGTGFLIVRPLLNGGR